MTVRAWLQCSYMYSINVANYTSDMCLVFFSKFTKPLEIALGMRLRKVHTKCDLL